ncbi:MAG: homoserine dehydrogenase [Chloroflexi bacterium]|nr:homoserine dehydrogenase [Chloroflexota bacterium]
MDVRLALTGFGNVGRGVATLLLQQGREYERRYGVRLVLAGVADRGGAAVHRDGLQPASLLQAKERHGTVAGAQGGVPRLAGAEFLERAAAQVLLEAASTNFDDAEPGWGYVREAISRGMDLVLASKGALVLHFAQLTREVEEEGLRLFYSGTVGAPLPILELADRMLVGARIDAFEGILNATTNQILTLMAEGATYEDGVRRAQEIGIAETDPTLDVDGWDAAAKAAIVANTLLGANLALADVHRQGIRNLSLAELGAAREQGETVKLIARAARTSEGVRASVQPERRPLADSLGRLRNDEMGIVFHTDPLGAVAATVQQTGGIPTALTVLRDVVNLARERGWSSPTRG